ncbi:MAG: SixA phosphatase family protein [Cyclobacteriaceae bacterium]
MKTLYLVRHAKSSWKDSSLPDFDRPLNQRGKKDAPEMGERLFNRGISPDLVISSTAKRAAHTASIMAEKLSFPAKAMRFYDELYHANADTLLQLVRNTDASVEKLMLFGHNPGLTEFANLISSRKIDNIVTCGVYALQLPVEQWRDFRGQGRTHFLFYDFPKNRS